MMIAMLGTALLLAAAPAPEAPQCPRDAEPIPAELAAWSPRSPLPNASALAVGRGYDLKLLPVAEVKFPAPPDRKELDGYGGLAPLAVDRAGTYRVALGSGAWVDVLKDGKALESVGHGHGPACSGIRKMVDFALEPGSYTVTIDGSDDTSIPILVTRLP